MVFGHYGKSIDLFSLRQQFNISSRGATLYSIRTIAVQMGMTARALSLDLNELNVLRRPCILHWNFNHFVVLVSVKRNGFVLHDPARGELLSVKPKPQNVSQALRWSSGQGVHSEENELKSG